MNQALKIIPQGLTSYEMVDFEELISKANHIQQYRAILRMLKTIKYEQLECLEKEIKEEKNGRNTIKSSFQRR